MKKRILLFSILMAVLSFSACSFSFNSDNVENKQDDVQVSNLPENQSSDFLAYDKDVRFAISYPKNWDIMGSSQLGGNSDFLAISPLEGDNDNFRENVNVIVDSNAINMNLDEYVDNSLSQLDKVIDLDAQAETNKGSLKNLDYVYIKYSGQMKKDIVGENAKVLPLTWEQYIVENPANNMKFIITFTASKDKYLEYKDLFDKIFNSFQIK